MSADELMPLVTVARFSYHDSEKHIGVGVVMGDNSKASLLSFRVIHQKCLQAST